MSFNESETSLRIYQTFAQSILNVTRNNLKSQNKTIKFQSQ